MDNNKPGMRIMASISKRSGFTLIELLIVVAIMGLIIGAIYKVADLTLLTYHASDDRQVLVSQARHALERMVMFVQESDEILTPTETDPTEALAVSERISDQYDNASHAYTALGDGIPDADNDANGLINNISPDLSDFITYDLDKTTDPANWRLMEQMPQYGTSLPPKKIICEHVQAFSCRRLLSQSGTFSGRVEINLTLKQGNATVSLQTTAKARWVE
jgi:prepilin-type N-terminal cleavage/methylation domain-containing protein